MSVREGYYGSKRYRTERVSNFVHASEFIDEVALITGLRPKDVQKVLYALFETLVDIVMFEEEDVKIPRLGRFTRHIWSHSNHWNAHERRYESLPPRPTFKFRPTRRLKMKMNGQNPPWLQRESQKLVE